MIDLRRLPKHVAIIMDGNGRWAERAGKPRTEGHRQGAEAVRRIVRSCRRLGIESLTLYAFSEQNWRRPPTEVTTLMRLLRQFLLSERAELTEKEIRLRSIGRSARLPRSVRDVLDPIVQETSSYRGMTLTLALSYGGREEIVDAARKLAKRVEAGELRAANIDSSAFESALESAQPGPVDLLIRTGGEQRISNFLLWGSAYAELVFSDKLWPEYDESDLFTAIGEFQGRERRFGTVRARIKPQDQAIANASVRSSKPFGGDGGSESCASLANVTPAIS